MFNHLYMAYLLLNKLAGPRLFGSTCNLLVSGENMREVVQICVDPARFNKCACQNMFEPLVVLQKKNVVDEWFKGLMGQNLG